MDLKTKLALLARSVLVLALICAAGVLPARAQTRLLFEGFEGAFPNAAWSSVTDTNPLNGLTYWNDVNSTFGTVSPHSGSWKGYCAGVNFIGSSAAPLYNTNMDAVMTSVVNLGPYNRATLRFWSIIPSIENGFDSARVYIDTNLVWIASSPIPSWTETAISLNNFVGGSHTIKFQFHTDGSVIAEGWYLDDIEINATTAPMTNSFVSFDYTNYTGYIVNGDATTNNPAFNRESLLVNTVISSENFQTNATNFAYQFTYRLRDTNGALFPLVDSTGLTNAALNYVATNLVSLPALGRTNTTNFASLKPAGRLSHLTSYKIEVDVARVGGTVLYSDTNGPFHFYHFTNAVSGDASYNVISEFLGSGIERSWIVDLIPGSNTFSVTNVVAFRRYDEFESVFPPIASLPVRLDVELRHATNNTLIPLVNTFSNYNVLLGAYKVGSFNPPLPTETTNTLVLNVRPAAQLNSVDTTYRLIVRMTYTNTVSQPGIAVASMTNGPARLLQFNGNLIFNDIATTFNAVSATPSFGAATLGSYIAASVAVSACVGTRNQRESAAHLYH